MFFLAKVFQLELKVVVETLDKEGSELEVLWGQPIKLIQVVSTSEFHEY